MRKIRILATLLLTYLCVPITAQNYTVTDFEESLLDVITTNVKDRNGNNCAVIKFSTGDNGFTVDNAVSSFENAGNLYVFVPGGTDVLTIRHRVHRTLIYRIPVHIQSGCHYTAIINIKDTHLIGKVDSDKYLYANVGMNIIPFMGPHIAIGYMFKSFSAELGFTYGLNKTDDIYFYGKEASILSAYNYQAMRASLHLGYSLTLSRHITLQPQIGAAYNIINGKEIKDITATNSSYMNGFDILSATVGVRMTLGFDSHFGLCVTPEYAIGLFNDDGYDLVKKFDKDMESWTNGFGLSVALMYKF